jgi:hypothetical protein
VIIPSTAVLDKLKANGSRYDAATTLRRLRQEGINRLGAFVAAFGPSSAAAAIAWRIYEGIRRAHPGVEFYGPARAWFSAVAEDPEEAWLFAAIDEWAWDGVPGCGLVLPAGPEAFGPNSFAIRVDGDRLELGYSVWRVSERGVFAGWKASEQTGTVAWDLFNPTCFEQLAARLAVFNVTLDLANLT